MDYVVTIDRSLRRYADWTFVIERDEKLHFMRETKSMLD